MELPLPMKRLSGYLSAVLLLAALASLWGQRPTEIAVSQVAATAAEWGDLPASPLEDCIVGSRRVDAQYRLYLCVPDRRWMDPGHKPRLWVRFIPDPTYLPGGY